MSAQGRKTSRQHSTRVINSCCSKDVTVYIACNCNLAEIRPRSQVTRLLEIGEIARVPFLVPIRQSLIRGKNPNTHADQRDQRNSDYTGTVR